MVSLLYRNLSFWGVSARQTSRSCGSRRRHLPLGNPDTPVPNAEIALIARMRYRKGTIGDGMMRDVLRRRVPRSPQCPIGIVRSWLRLCVVGISVAYAGVALPAAALPCQVDGYPGGKVPTATVALVDVNLTEVFKRVFASSGVPYRIEPGAASAGERHMFRRVELDGVSMSYAIWPLLAYTNIGYRLDGSTWVVDLRPVSVNADNVSAGKLFQILLNAAGCDYVISDSPRYSRMVTLHIQNMPFQAALERVLEATGPSGMTVRWSYGVCVVSLPARERSPADAYEPVVSVSLHGIKLDKAISLICAACHSSSVYPEGIPDPVISLRFTNELSNAVYTALESIPGNARLWRVNMLVNPARYGTSFVINKMGVRTKL